MPDVLSPSVYGSPDGAEGWLNSVRLFTSAPGQVFQMSGGKLPADGSCSSPLLVMQPAWYGFRSWGMASGVLANPLTVWATTAGLRFVHVTVSPAWMTFGAMANSLMDSRGLSGLPPPASTCQVFVPSRFDASGGLVNRSWLASQARSASYWRWAAASNWPALCSGWSGATTSIQPLIVGPSTRLVKMYG